MYTARAYEQRKMVSTRFPSKNESLNKKKIKKKRIFQPRVTIRVHQTGRELRTLQIYYACTERVVRNNQRGESIFRRWMKDERDKSVEKRAEKRIGRVQSHLVCIFHFSRPTQFLHFVRKFWELKSKTVQIGLLPSTSAGKASGKCQLWNEIILRKYNNFETSSKTVNEIDSRSYFSIFVFRVVENWVLELLARLFLTFWYRIFSSPAIPPYEKQFREKLRVFSFHPSIIQYSETKTGRIKQIQSRIPECFFFLSRFPRGLVTIVGNENNARVR